MELHIEDETVEPSIPHASAAGRPVKRRLKWADVQARLECCAFGRLLLDGMRWGVVAALIVTGYVTAAGIDSGLTALYDAGPAATNAQQILAASAAHK
jgi:hypothetical protein